jgi:farnesyl diphosphate synthase
MKEANTLADELIDELNNFDEKLRDNLSPLLIKYINRHRN